jgi:hypothetical protein
MKDVLKTGLILLLLEDPVLCYGLTFSLLLDYRRIHVNSVDALHVPFLDF